ncbi:MAG TPA: hypothetical protein VLL48_08905, partial [Longimicrobiales bacterium]|nr:hypothetical protein [Longimicrobiales bacterium]
PAPRPFFARPNVATSPVAGSRRKKIHRRITLFLQAVLFVGLALSIWNGVWMNAFLVGVILLLTFWPSFVGRRFEIFIPPEFELVAIVIIFATLYLGEIQGYYVCYAWWDKVLHTSSGFLLGVLGFLLVYVLNQDERIDLSMKPGFVALFAFAFSVAVGALWEVFEFAMDSFFGMNMQKSGLVDTMWDIIVDSVGALAVALLGYAWMTRDTDSFLEDWIESFIEANPRLFESE